MKGKRVLIIGGKGFIGEHLSNRLKADNEVGILDIKNGEHEDILKISKNDFYYDVVYHLGAFVSVKDSMLEPFNCYETNVVGLMNTLKHIHVDRHVFASSCAIYGDIKDPLGVAELDSTDISLEELNSPYAKSKKMGESIISDTCESYAILRFFNVYGENQNPEYGAVIQKMIEADKVSGEFLIYGDGNQTRDFISVDDVTSALEYAGDSQENFISNVGTGRITSINELVEIVDPNAKVAHDPDEREGDIRFSRCYVPTKLSSETNWKPLVSLEEGIANLNKNG